MAVLGSGFLKFSGHFHLARFCASLGYLSFFRYNLGTYCDVLDDFLFQVQKYCNEFASEPSEISAYFSE